MNDDQICADCGETESEMTYCHACNKTICEDNCVASSDDEQGLDFCHACTEANDAATERATKQAADEASATANSAGYDQLMQEWRKDAEEDDERRYENDLPW